MAERQKGMGRGLAAILSVAPKDDSEEFRQLPVETSFRRTRDSRGARSTRTACSRWPSRSSARGVLQPVLVRPIVGGRYELIAGERRWRAAGIAELDMIPAVIRRHDDAGSLEMALIENMAREDLNPVEEARACAALVEELGLTREEVGLRVGRSRVAVSNLIRLLDLPDEALELIESGELTEGHGRAFCWPRITPTAASSPRTRLRAGGRCASSSHARVQRTAAHRDAPPLALAGERSIQTRRPRSSRSPTRSGRSWAPTSTSRRRAAAIAPTHIRVARRGARHGPPAARARGGLRRPFPPLRAPRRATFPHASGHAGVRRPQPHTRGARLAFRVHWLVNAGGDPAGYLSRKRPPRRMGCGKPLQDRLRGASRVRSREDCRCR